MSSNPSIERTCPGKPGHASHVKRSGDASRHPNGPAARARGSGREARPEPAAAPENSMRSDIFVGKLR